MTATPPSHTCVVEEAYMKLIEGISEIISGQDIQKAEATIDMTNAIFTGMHMLEQHRMNRILEEISSHLNDIGITLVHGQIAGGE